MSYYFNSECRIVHALSHLIANCLYFCNDKISVYKRCIGVKSQVDDMKEHESFTANIGRDKDISHEGRDVNAFSYCSILGIITLYTRVNLFVPFFFALKKQVVFFFLGAEVCWILISFNFVFFFGGVGWGWGW